MAKNFKDLRAKLSPERQRRNKEEADRAVLEMSLQELRQKVSDLSQDDVAEMLDVTQGYISKLEHQDDMLVSKLYAYVEALGGEVEIRARVRGQEVQIKGLRGTEKLKAALGPKPKKKSA